METTDRTRLKDKIIDNISKAIKSIQELVYYHSKDPTLDGTLVTLCNGNWQCHKLCENLDHALLHGLKQVAHGYWRVVKELSHKEMVREIDLLAKVTTDLGKGRAWLYASLNEGLLESHIRVLCNHEKLLKKFYAKEALLLDSDRMNILLTHTFGLDHVQFQLEYDVPYLDLNAYPPRIRSNSESDDQVRSTTPQSFQNSCSSLQSRPQNCASPTESSNHPASDSDSASVTSLDAWSQPEIANHMKASTISSDSGCPVDGAVTEDPRYLSVTPTEAVTNTREKAGISGDNASLSSVGSSGDLDRHKRLADIIPAGDEEEGGSDSLEVIRVRSKKGNGQKSKKKKHLLPMKDDQDRGSKSSLSDLTENSRNGSAEETHGITVKLVSPDGKQTNNIVGQGTVKVTVDNGLPHSHSNNEKITKHISSPEDYCDPSDSNTVSASMPKLDSGIDICELTTSCDRSLPSSIHKSDINGQVPSESFTSNTKLPSVSPHSANIQKSVQEQIENKIAELYPVSVSDASNHKASTTSTKHEVGIEPGCPDTSQASNSGLNHTDKLNSTSRHSPVITAALESSDHKQRSEGINHDTTKLTNSSHSLQSDTFTEKVSTEERMNRPHGKQSSREADDAFDVYSSNKQETLKPALSASTKSSAQSAVQLKDYMDYILTSELPPVDNKDRQEIKETEADLSLNLDNNTKLQLMLDIFTHEDEKLLKMFVTRENHTEGGSGVVFVLISDLCLYLLHYRPASKKFALESSAMLQDLLFLSTGINEQTLNIESRDRNNQKQRLWLTTGHQALTLSIVACLTGAVRAVSDHILPAKSRFIVESEVPLQTIALRKYIFRELQCEVQDVTINDYSLVFWDDPSAATSQSHDADAAYKEGTLLIRSQDPLKPPVWKPVYVVLKNSMLCVSNKKSDPRPHSYLGLGGDQCVGCRATSTADREHCIELILAQGGSWLLAAASQTEISEWRHALCLAVSQGTVDDNNTLLSCVPCCAVLSCNHLFLCHEDLHTKFYRTLGRAQLEDVTGIEIDSVDSSYCIIEFESQQPGVSSNQWVLYFSSAEDLQRYKQAIGSAWRNIYQIELPVWPVNNVALRRHCSMFADQLRQQLTLK
ncbi:hypothetical protein BsWGS_26996 [Bradybaena similaris]